MSSSFARATAILSPGSQVAIYIIIAILAIVNVLFILAWFRHSTFREYIRSWNCFNRPQRVRTRDRINSWSIDDPGSLSLRFGRDSPFNSSSASHRSYSHIPESNTASPVKRLWWKVCDLLQFLIPFKKRPVPVKSRQLHARTFFTNPSPQIQRVGPSHLRLDSSFSFHNDHDDTPYRSSENSASSANTLGSWTKSWGSSWKNPFKSSKPSSTTTTSDSFNHSARPSQSMFLGEEAHPRTSGATTTTTLNDISNPPAEPPAPERENSVLLISRVPGVDFSLSSCQTLASIEVIPPSPRPRSSSLTGLDLYASPTYTHRSLDDDSPSQRLLQDNENLPPYSDRMLRPSRSNPAVRSARTTTDSTCPLV